MKLSELLEHIIVLDSNVSQALEIRDLCYDSRKAAPGVAFVAIRGFETDGHRFISNAVAAGAPVIICEDRPANSDVPFVQVENSRSALALMSCALFGYPSRRMKVVGVTGTSGKTTSTHLIRHILEEVTHSKVGLIGTNGNWIGTEELHTEHTTPESYELQKLFREMADKGCTYAVMEVSSHALVLDRVDGTEYDVAAYTNLSQDHLDFHGDMETYAAAKSLLFRMCRTACVNVDDAHAHLMLASAEESGCKMISTAVRDSAANLVAQDLRYTASAVNFTACTATESVPVHLAIPGSFSVYNGLTALSTALALGISLTAAAAALASATGVKGRVENVPTGLDYTVLIDYSHKPDALEKILITLRPVTEGRLIVLFGCGGDRDRAKRPIMGRVACENADIVFVTSDNPRTEDPDAIISEILIGTDPSRAEVVVICDRVEAIHRALDKAASGDVILLAGKGHEDYQVVGHEKHHMDEREIVADYLREKRNV